MSVDRAKANIWKYFWTWIIAKSKPDNIIEAIYKLCQIK